MKVKVYMQDVENGERLVCTINRACNQSEPIYSIAISALLPLFFARAAAIQMCTRGRTIRKNAIQNINQDSYE